MFFQATIVITALLPVSRFVIGARWCLVLVIVALWACYCSLRTFFVLALVFFVISHVSFCLQICLTEDVPLTRNRFLSKVIFDQIRVCHPCGVLMLKYKADVTFRVTNWCFLTRDCFLYVMPGLRQRVVCANGVSPLVCPRTDQVV